MGKALDKRNAEQELDDARRAVCKTCDTFVHNEHDEHCPACRQYWQDVRDGIFDDDY